MQLKRDTIARVGVKQALFFGDVSRGPMLGDNNWAQVVFTVFHPEDSFADEKDVIKKCKRD